MKNIFLLAGHVLENAIASQLADAYEQGARKAGHNVKRMNLWSMEFDPVLHNDYKIIQDLEPSLVEMQNAIKKADHLVFIYPNWWSTMPAKLKGVFDRAFLPGFAFNFDKENGKVIKLLKGKSARVITTNGSLSPMLVKMYVGDNTNEIRNGVLKFCGVSPVRMSAFGPTSKCAAKKLVTWKQNVENLGYKGI